jgi:DNA polymerase III alpha subunit|tara:strand:+ start:215 stop:688 length:474 start_codon:yes stop_codon:yes gene_type:complete
MIKNKFGEIVYNIEDVVDLMMSEQNVSGITVDDTVKLDDVMPETDISLSVDEYDLMNQHNWLMPEEYKQIDIAQHVIDCCKTDAEIQRAGEELLMFQQRNLFNLLKYLRYLVDTMKTNNIIWGVGRGSSVASYVLYLLGVHRVDSMYYDLDPKEFLR